MWKHGSTWQYSESIKTNTTPTQHGQSKIALANVSTILMQTFKQYSPHIQIKTNLKPGTLYCVLKHLV